MTPPATRRGNCPLRRSNAAAISPDGVAGLTGWRRPVRSRWRGYLTTPGKREFLAPLEDGEQYCRRPALRRRPVRVLSATKDGSSSWRCCDTGIRVGVFGSSTRTGDEDNAVILAA